MATESRWSKRPKARFDLPPEMSCSAFILRAIEERSVDEVAEILDIPATTVRTQHFHTRTILREGLAGEIDLAIGDVFSFAGERYHRIVAHVMARASAESVYDEE